MLANLKLFSVIKKSPVPSPHMFPN